jgi:hypothetical protein
MENQHPVFYEEAMRGAGVLGFAGLGRTRINGQTWKRSRQMRGPRKYDNTLVNNSPI